jgi:hypothetical protein
MYMYIWRTGRNCGDIYIQDTALLSDIVFFFCGGVKD